MLTQLLVAVRHGTAIRAIWTGAAVGAGGPRRCCSRPRWSHEGGFRRLERYARSIRPGALAFAVSATGPWQAMQQFAPQPASSESFDVAPAKP
jgi:hypothetical protein